MKVLLYFQDEKTIKTSGIGRARVHQSKALSLRGIEYTYNPHDSFDVAHINTIWGKSQRLLRKCKRKGIPVIVHGHSTHEDFRNSFALWRLIEPFFDKTLDYMYKRADLIITPTPYSRDLISSYGFGPKVIDISNGIDVNEYKEDPEAVKEFKEKFGIKEGEKFVMGVGFPFQRKGLQDFIEVAKKFPDVKFIWFGHLTRIAVSNYIKKAVAHKSDNVIMPGYVKGKLIHGAYQCASLMFFPSYEETEGIVVLEALASKCPLLVRDIGVYRPWLKDGVNCHMAKDNEGFEKEIAKLLEQKESKSILDEGYKVAEERNLAAIGAKLEEAYKSLLVK